MMDDKNDIFTGFAIFLDSDVDKNEKKLNSKAYYEHRPFELKINISGMSTSVWSVSMKY